MISELLAAAWLGGVSVDTGAVIYPDRAYSAVQSRYMRVDPLHASTSLYAVSASPLMHPDYTGGMPTPPIIADETTPLMSSRSSTSSRGENTRRVSVDANVLHRQSSRRRIGTVIAPDTMPRRGRVRRFMDYVGGGGNKAASFGAGDTADSPSRRLSRGISSIEESTADGDASDAPRTRRTSSVVMLAENARRLSGGLRSLASAAEGAVSGSPSRRVQTADAAVQTDPVSHRSGYAITAAITGLAVGGGSLLAYTVYYLITGGS